MRTIIVWKTIDGYAHFLQAKQKKTTQLSQQ